MAPFRKPTLAVVLSSSLLLQSFLILDRQAVSAAAVVVARRRSLDVGSAQADCRRSSPSGDQYAVVIDAGSSGSRVHVYRWPRATAGRVESIPGAVQPLRPTLNIRVGLETVAGDLTVVRQHVEQLLTNASRIVPPQLHRYTPVYFFATAGMREMLEQRMDELMTYVDGLMMDSDINPFSYDPVAGSRVLSGEEEAAFDWISVNYLLGNFADKADKPLVGVVEMGGASVQIAFVPDDDVSGHLFPVHVNNRRYLLYAHSYLGLGESSVVEHIKTRLETAEPASKVIHNPCMLRGDVQTSADGRTMVGTGQPQACVDLLREHVLYRLDDTSRCRRQQCATGAVINQPSLPRHRQFYAVGAFIYTLPSLDALGDDAMFVPALGYHKAFEFCHLPYDEALLAVSEAQRRYVTDKCLAALYIPLLLNQGLGFSNDSSVIHVPGNIAGQKPGWTLGAVLYENSKTQRDCEHAAAAAVAADDDDDDDDEDIRVVLSRLMIVGSDRNIR